MSVHRDESRLDAVVRIDQLPPEGRVVQVVSTPEQRAAIAAQLGITAVEALGATLSVVRFRGGMRVTGRLSGRIEQPCVVTLAPVFQDIDESVERTYLPGEEDRKHVPGAEIFVDLEGDDLPDHFDGREADLADMLIETLALALDPYPRAEGAALESDGDPRNLEEESPFAALRRLKTDDANG